MHSSIIATRSLRAFIKSRLSSVLTSREGSARAPWLLLLDALNYAVLPLGVLGAWQLVSVFNWVPAVALPSPSRVAQVFWEVVCTGEIFGHVAISLARVLLGFAIAAIFGITLGIGIGLSRRLERTTDLMLELLRPIPPIAWIPLAILWFGIGELSKIYIIFVGAFFPIVLNVISGVRQTEQKFVELASVLQVPRRKFVRHVVLPGALPVIMSSLRLGLGIAWVCVVAAELIAASRGVGFLIMDARQLSQPDLVIVGMITIGIIGKTMDAVIKRIQRHVIVWKTTFPGR